MMKQWFLEMISCTEQASWVMHDRSLPSNVLTLRGWINGSVFIPAWETRVNPWHFHLPQKPLELAQAISPDSDTKWLETAFVGKGKRASYSLVLTQLMVSSPFWSKGAGGKEMPSLATVEVLPSSHPTEVSLWCVFDWTAWAPLLVEWLRNWLVGIRSVDGMEGAYRW